MSTRRWAALALVVLAALGLALCWALLPAELYFSLKGPLREVLLVAGAGAMGLAGLWAWLAVRRAEAYASKMRRELAQRAAEEARRAEADASRIRLLEKEYRTLLVNLDHEMGNPLTGILGALDELADAPAGEEHPESLATIRVGAKQLRGLAAGLQSLREVGEKPIALKPVDAVNLMRELYDWASGRPDARGREILPSFGPPIISPVQAEANLLPMALRNLVDNAVKYTRPGDRIYLRALQDGSTVIIEVGDTGPGIPNREIDRIWEPFRRGESARERRIPGAGVGLALVREIIERCGGQIGVRSREGEGTAFTVRLPIS